MSNKNEIRISSNQIKKNIVKQFNTFYKGLETDYLNDADIENLKKLRDSISMILIASNELELVDELLDVEEAYV